MIFYLKKTMKQHIYPVSNLIKPDNSYSITSVKQDPKPDIQKNKGFILISAFLGFLISAIVIAGITGLASYLVYSGSNSNRILSGENFNFIFNNSIIGGIAGMAMATIIAYLLKRKRNYSYLIVLGLTFWFSIVFYLLLEAITGF